MRGMILCLVAATVMGQVAAAQGTSPKEEAKRAEVLVLGVYHMANPGHDVFNMHADDVLLPSARRRSTDYQRN